MLPVKKFKLTGSKPFDDQLDDANQESLSNLHSFDLYPSSEKNCFCFKMLECFELLEQFDKFFFWFCYKNPLLAGKIVEIYSSFLSAWGLGKVPYGMELRYDTVKL